MKRNGFNYSLLHDKQLIDLLIDEDHQAFSEIYQRHRQLLLVFAFKKLQNKQMAEDIVQDVFLAFWNKKAMLRPEINLPAYLMTCVKNSLFNFYAHQDVASKYIQSITESVNTGSIAHADYSIREKDIRHLIEQALDSLPKKMRQIFELHRESELTYKEIAQNLEISEKTVNAQMLNALNRLRSRLAIILFAFFYWL